MLLTPPPLSPLETDFWPLSSRLVFEMSGDVALADELAQDPEAHISTPLYLQCLKVTRGIVYRPGLESAPKAIRTIVARIASGKEEVWGLPIDVFGCGSEKIWRTKEAPQQMSPLEAMDLELHEIGDCETCLRSASAPFGQGRHWTRVRFRRSCVVRRGRPRGTGLRDERFFPKMRQLVESGAAQSPTDAAKQVYHGYNNSIIKRLVRKYKRWLRDAAL